MATVGPFTEIFEKLLEDCGFTKQSELADFLHLHETTVGKWHFRVVPPRHMRKIQRRIEERALASRADAQRVMPPGRIVTKIFPDGSQLRVENATRGDLEFLAGSLEPVKIEEARQQEIGHSPGSEEGGKHHPKVEESDSSNLVSIPESGDLSPPPASTQKASG